MYNFMTLKSKNLLIPFFIFFSSSIYADCDCTTVVGKCNGAIEFIKGYGSNKNFGAEIIVHSSEPKCSKVEYFVDATPYQNILSNSNSVNQSLFSTKQISEKNIEYQKCTICKSSNSVTKVQKEDESDFVGNWNGSTRNFLGFKNNLSLHISHIDGNKYNVSYDFSGKTYPGIGTLENNVLSASPTGGCNLKLNLISKDKLNWFCSISSFTSQGVFTKSN